MVDKKYYIGFDFLRILVTFTVVLLHSHSTDLVVRGFFLEKIFPPANAIFAGMAGFLLMHMIDSDTFVFKGWLLSRSKRLVVPYWFWTGIYLLLNFCYDWVMHKPSCFDFSSVRQWLSVLFCGGGTVQLWFIAMLFWVQLFAVLLSRVERIRKYLPISLLILGVCLPRIIHMESADSSVSNFLFMLKYLAFGLLLARLDLMKSKRIAYFAVALTGIIGIQACRLLGINIGFLATDAIVVLWLTVGLAWPFSGRPAAVIACSEVSMGIYLVHIVFTTIVGLLFQRIGIVSPYAMVAIAVLVFVLSWGTVIGLKRIPLLRTVVG